MVPSTLGADRTLIACSPKTIAVIVSDAAITGSSVIGGSVVGGSVVGRSVAGGSDRVVVGPGSEPALPS